MATTSLGVGKAFPADTDLCNQCDIAPVCPKGDSNTTPECCTFPCPIGCPAAAIVSTSPRITNTTALPCPTATLACCTEPMHHLDVKPTIIACQGIDCPDAAVVVCNDVECVAPSEDISGQCSSTCDVFSGVQSNSTFPSSRAPSNCPACDDDPAKSYSSFQELLDCWCCSDLELPPCGSDNGSACASLSLDCETCCIDESLPPLTVNQSTFTPGTMSSEYRSRNTSLSTSTLLSPTLSNKESLEFSTQYWSRQEANRAKESQRIEKQMMECIFEGEHRHNEAGICLPPVVTLKNNHQRFQNDSSAPPSACNLYTCHWAGCGLQCTSTTELASHVNTVHLAAIASSTNTEAVTSNSMSNDQASSILWGQQDHTLRCLWDSCQLHERVPEAIWRDGNLILEHILQAHVGIDDSFSSASSSNSKRKRETDDEIKHLEVSSSLTNEGEIISIEKDEDDDDGVHRCKWKGCSEIFTDHEELTNHITLNHVGSGKGQYECQWQGCNRGNRTFYQKQKILRHLQTHTGYRPFKCNICHKYFSEPSTLAQHKRTHTKEKPYACEEPGCGKSFAVAASLTIHKRVHTGEKPFKCKWPGCTIAFSESSNLRKHFRIHTGERPFRCNQEGCSKTFSRPDQLARHRKTHQKETCSQ